MYVSEIYAEGFFVTFSFGLKNVKSRSKVALFSNERHFEIWFPKKRTITFFWSKLPKLHQKDPNLHVATTFSLKQGETWTSHGPIPQLLTKEFKRGVGSVFDNCVNAMGRRPYWPSRMEVSYCTLGFGAIIQCDLRISSLPRDNLYACVIKVHAGKATHA